MRIAIVYASEDPTSNPGDPISYASYEAQTDYGRIPSGAHDGGVPTFEEQVAELRKTDPVRADELIQRRGRRELISAQLQQNAGRAWTWIPIPGTYICYTQEEDAFCAPACAQSIIHYMREPGLDPSEPTQRELASEMGIDLQNGGKYFRMLDPINKYQSRLTYMADSVVYAPDFRADLMDTITNFEAPASVNIIVTDNNPDWYYKTDGHAVNINSARSDGGAFQIADPIIKRISDSGHPFYPKSFSTLSRYSRTYIH